MREAGEAAGSEGVSEEDVPEREASSESVPEEAEEWSFSSPFASASDALSAAEPEPAPAADAAASASRSAISRLSAAGENRIVAPLSTSPPPNGPASALSAAGTAGAGAAGTCACGVSGAAGAAGASSAAGATGSAGAEAAGAGGAGAQLGSKPPGVADRSGEDRGAPIGGGGGARCEPAPPDESPAAFCVYQAGGV
ncbi:hypothetical protein V6574_27140 [Streptomyces sp. SM1P]